MTGFQAIVVWLVLLAMAIVFDSITIFILWCFTTPIVIVAVLVSLF